MDAGTVTVRGTATVPGRPDRVEVALTVASVQPSPDDALRDVTERAQALGSVLEALAIDRGAWSTSGVTLHEERPWEGDRFVHRGYKAASRISVRLSDFTLIGQLLLQAIHQAGAQVTGPWWSFAADNPARTEACGQAAADARRKAEAYAGALGVRAGAVLAIAEPETTARDGFGFVPLSARSSGSPEMDVQPGELDVTAAVDVTFHLEPPG